MRNSQGFDYEQASPDTIIGINVEASDCASDEVVRVYPAVQPRPVAEAPTGPEELFGLTLTVDDTHAADQLNVASQT